MNNLNKAAYALDESAHYLGIGKTKLREEIAAGRLSAKKCGRKVLLLRTDLEAYLQALPDAEWAGSALKCRKNNISA